MAWNQGLLVCAKYVQVLKSVSVKPKKTKIFKKADPAIKKKNKQK